MILSISRRTDIPALYTPWLAGRFRAGWCEVQNPYNVRQVARVSLRREDVDAIVFWTRHARPLFGLLPWLDARDFQYYVQYTITGYDRRFERRTPSVETAVSTFVELAERLPPGAVVWRYDPILVGDAFPPAEHVQRFARIARGLEGRTRRVVVSVVDPYRKTMRRMGEHLHAEPRTWPGLRPLLGNLVRIAHDHGMTAEACAEEDDYAAQGLLPSKCVDDRLLGALYGGAWSSRKDPGQRSACRCVPSKDIGVPGTCTFGCAYCYATPSDRAAVRRRTEHITTSERLVRT